MCNPIKMKIKIKTQYRYHTIEKKSNYGKRQDNKAYLKLVNQEQQLL